MRGHYIKKVKLMERATFVSVAFTLKPIPNLRFLSLDCYLIRFLITMSQRFVCALLTTGVVCYALAESNEFAATSEFVKKEPTGDRPLANIVRARNLSETPYPNSAEGHNKHLDKQTRTADHRSESESRDKWNI